MKNANLLSRIKAETRKVDEIILKVIGNGLPSELFEASRHLLQFGGKRLRAYVVLASCGAAGGDPMLAFNTAAAVELIHNLTLIHDDIIDEDVRRRGHPTTHVVWGIPISITAADFLMPKAYLCVLESRGSVADDKLLRIIWKLSAAGAELSQGQAMDIVFQKANRVTEEDYLLMASKKTAALFGASAWSGGMIGGATEAELEGLERYGFNLGLGFQLMDDILGVAGDESLTGKPLGSDIREGKKTLVLMKAIEMSDDRSRKVLLGLSGKRDATESEIMTAIEVISESGATSEIEKLAKNYAQRAVSSLNPLDLRGGTRGLVELARMAVQRQI